MSEATENPGATSAGRLLREAREAQGLRLEALAHTLKVPPQKLEALEADRYDELPDTAFTRGLAQAVCRSLKIDAAPALALLPRAAGYRLEQIGEGLNTPFRERPGRLDPVDGGILASPAVWGPALLLLAASVVYWWPTGLLSRLHEQATEVVQGAPPAPLPEGSAPLVVLPAVLPTGGSAETAPADVKGYAPADGAAEATAAAQPDAVAKPGESAQTLVADAGSSAAAEAAASATAGTPESLLQVQAAKTSWVEVIDARGRLLLSRLVKPGETVALDGDVPLKVRIGNAADTQLVFRGQPLALAPYTRDNLAKLELK
jgi:cytoskeleton protein RodZ